MKTLLSLAAVLFPAISTLHGETTPLTQPLKRDDVTPITCELTQAPRYSEVPVFSSQKEADSAVGTYHYKLYLPKGYDAEPAKQWPCFFVMSTSGKASMADVGVYAKAHGYIVVMLQEAKNGPWVPIMGNFLAAHDDVMKRARIGAKYAVGHSGGARASSVWVQLRPGFQGLVMEGAGASSAPNGSYNVAGIKRQPQLRIAMTMGNADKNSPEAGRMQGIFGKDHLLFLPFEGGHVWAPADVFEKAMTWVTAKAPTAGSPSGVGSKTFDDFFKKK